MLFSHSYQSSTYPDFVNYVAFSDDVESVFTTKNLEKAPLLQAQQFQPPQEWDQKNLSPEMESILFNCMDRLAEKVRPLSRHS